MKGKSHMKMLIIAVPALLVIAAILTVIWVKSRTFDGGGMANDAAVESFYYYYGPDEYGGSESISMKDGKLSSSADGGTVGGSEELTCAYDAEFESAFEEIVRSYGVKEWTDLPASELEVLDGATASVTVTFADGTVVNLGDDCEMPENGWKAVREMTDLIEAYLKEHG